MSDFTRNAGVIGSALSVCCRMFEGSMGTLTPPHESRIARDPLGVITDLEWVLIAARDQIKNPNWRSVVEE